MRLYRSLILGLLLSLISVSSFGAEPDFSQGRRVGKPFLYKLTKNNISSYIFGFQHVYLSLDDFPIYVEKAILKTSYFAGESAGESDSSGNEQNERPQVKNVDIKLLSKKARQNLKIRGIPENLTSSWNSYELGYIYMTWENYEPVFMRGEEYKSMDTETEAVARKSNKIIFALDNNSELQEMNTELQGSIDDLNAMLETDPFEIKEDMLTRRLNMLSGIEEFDDKNDSLVDDPYLTGKRNLNWIKVLKPYENKSVFIAVGSGHLFGKYGMLELLKQQGFKVQRVQYESDL